MKHTKAIKESPLDIAFAETERFYLEFFKTGLGFVEDKKTKKIGFIYKEIAVKIDWNPKGGDR